MTIEQKRRELFEAWAASRSLDLEYRNIPGVGQFYECPRTLLSMDAFNAALDAVVIQLPDKCDVEEWSESLITLHEGYSKELIIESIESIGLGLKVLP